MGKHIVHTRPDGGLSITTPGEGVDMVEVLARIPDGNINVREIDSRDIPGDREFRNAWSDDGANLTVDMVKARVIQKERIDEAKLLSASDLAGRELLGEDITAEKTTLVAINSDDIVRDATTPDDLKASWPTGLRRK